MVMSAGSKKLWNPSETLGIINTDPGYQCITCIGYAPTQRRRCRNPIKAENSQFISETLNKISYLRPNSPAVTSLLRQIAGPALCVRHHQSQAETVVRKWQENITQIKPQIGERTRMKPVQNTRQDSKSDQALHDISEQLREIRELLAEMQGERKQCSQDQGYKQRENHSVENRKEEDRKRREREEREEEERQRKARKEEEDRKRRERERRERKERDEEAKRLEEERQREKRKEEEDCKKKAQRDCEQEAYNERIRQKAQRSREERERKAREKAQGEREEWDQSWAKYQDRWVSFKACTSSRECLRDSIPWPVKSGLARDVVASNVTEFMQMAVPRDADVTKLMRKECRKWHPDMVSRWPRATELTVVDQMMVDVVCRVVTDVLNKAAGRSDTYRD